MIEHPGERNSALPGRAAAAAAVAHVPVTPQRMGRADPPAIHDNMESWRALLAERMCELRATSGGDGRFSGQLQHFQLGPVDVNVMVCSAHRLRRTAELVDRCRPKTYELMYVRQGTVGVRHCGNSTSVPQGDFVLIDAQQPFELDYTGRTVCLFIHLDDRWLRRWVPHPRTMAGQPMEGGGWGAPLAAMLSTIADRGLAHASLPRSTIADQLGSLIALMGGASNPPASMHQGGMFARLKRLMQDRFDVLSLDPAAVASEMGFSKRHLHGIFAQSGTTFGEVLMGLRLGKAAEFLSDPRYAAYRVGDVAWACGFKDPSHFARRFRLRYGCSPQAYRDLPAQRPYCSNHSNTSPVELSNTAK